MRCGVRRIVVPLFAVILSVAGIGPSRCGAAPPIGELTSAQVKEAIQRARKFLADAQFRDRPGEATGLALLALLTSGLSVDDPAVAATLKYLRTSDDPIGSHQTYITSLEIMALAAAKERDKDKLQIERLARRLEECQITEGLNLGMWTYRQSNRNSVGDNSNTQFAVLGLREAAIAGAKIRRATWERIEAHFLETQNGDGGWGYHPRSRSTGSMTCAGICSLIICREMIGSEENDVFPNRITKCCSKATRLDQAVRRGVAWLSQYVSLTRNPGGGSALYYIYGLERTGRLSGRRFFGPHDWYREGVASLLRRQTRRDGSWNMSYGPVVSTGFALLFLSKGLAPVLINKLNYGGPSDVVSDNEETLPNWDLHPGDVRNLAEFISERPRWPKLLACQEIELEKVLAHGSVEDLLQAPILYISGRDDPKFTDAQVELLRSYVNRGGFIFAVNNCNGAGFEHGMRRLAARLYPEGRLERLKPEHPIYRAEFMLDPKEAELWGVEFACGASFIYSPKDHSCLWDKWSPVPRHPVEFNALIQRSLRVGVNVVAYATGREPYNKLDLPHDETAEAQESRRSGHETIERSLLQVAKLRHTGDWDVAPLALRNVLVALNQFSGRMASTRQQNLMPNDANLAHYPLLYMHGRLKFQFKPPDVEHLRKQLALGAVLFTDSCCGSAAFDASFRELVRKLYPEKTLQRIPITHELFSQGVGFDIRKVKSRIPASGNLSDPLAPTLRDGEPFLEGIELNGRYCVVYSKFDLSCALERQASMACAVYDHHDAIKIAVNVIRYTLLQDISYSEKIR